MRPRSFRLPDQQLADLEQLSLRTGVSVADYVRDGVHRVLVDARRMRLLPVDCAQPDERDPQLSIEIWR